MGQGDSYLRGTLDLETQSSSLSASVHSEPGRLVDDPSFEAGTVGLDLGIFMWTNLDIEGGPFYLLTWNNPN